MTNSKQIYKERFLSLVNIDVIVKKSILHSRQKIFMFFSLLFLSLTLTSAAPIRSDWQEILLESLFNPYREVARAAVNNPKKFWDIARTIDQV